jgi:outer membrane scaffolding protein for murein synthesis (MipA/OmpV family)
MSYRIAAPVAALLTIVAATTIQAQDAGAPPSRDFTGSIGIGVATMPKYAGSDEYRVLPIPIAQLEYKGRVYFGGSQNSVSAGVGAYVIRTQSITWDVGLTGAPPRAESYGDALAGMGKRNIAGFGATGVSYRIGTVMANAGVAVGLGKDQGAYGNLGIGTERQLSRRWVAGVSTGVTIANATNMAFDYGVTREQSDRRRDLVERGDKRLDGIDLAAYTPKAGIKEAQGSASLSYVLTPRSRVVMFGQATRLSGEAARSPIALTHTGVVSGVAIGWGF